MLIFYGSLAINKGPMMVLIGMNKKESQKE